MVNPSKKSAKSKAKIAAEAKRKKDILDKVAQSSLPTKTILKELGISRSTYYSWLKRYEEEGSDGLLDSRSLVNTPDEGQTAPPVVEEVKPEPVEEVKRVEIDRPTEAVADSLKEEEAKPSTPAQAVGKPEEPAAAPVEAEVEREDRLVMTEEKTTFGGGNEKKGMGAYSFIAILLLVIGLLISISSSNNNTYQLRKSGETLTLWKGKFAPRGSEVVESFEPLVVGNGDFSALLGKTFSSQDSVYQAIHVYYMEQVDAETAKGNEADMEEINRLLKKDESVIGNNTENDKGLAVLRFQLVQKRVAVAEMGLRQTYEKALPVYEEALKNGQGDAAEVAAKVAAMQAVLGVAAAEKTEAPAEQVEAPAEKAEAAGEPAKAAAEPVQPQGEGEPAK